GATVECLGDLLVRERLRPLEPRPRLSRDAYRPPSPADDAEHRVRYARKHERPGVEQRVDALVALEHADEKRARRVRDGGRRPRRDGDAVDVGRERRVGIAAELLNEPRGVRADRPYGVGPPDGDPAEQVAAWGEEGPQRRAVEPGSRAPVPLHVEDDPHTRAGEGTGEQDGRALVDALDEDDVGPEGA